MDLQRAFQRQVDDACQLLSPGDASCGMAYFAWFLFVLFVAWSIYDHIDRNGRK